MVLSRSRAKTRFIVLPPSQYALTSDFRHVEVNAGYYDGLLAKMQRFRGKVYLADGAIQPGDLVDGRHQVSIDEQSWHILSVDSEDSICACMRLRHLTTKNGGGFDDLWVRHALSRCQGLYQKFRDAVEMEMMRARQLKIGFGEVGGWAVAEEHRWTLEPLRIVIASFALGELLGGCAGVATATFRHRSAIVLRKVGLTALKEGGAELPPYYDPHHDCQMEVLRFDTRCPNPKYRASVRELSAALGASLVVCRDRTWFGQPDIAHRIGSAFGARPLLPERLPATA